MWITPGPSPASLDALRSAVDGRITAVIAGVEEPHLHEAVAYAIAGGKRIRALIAMLSAAASGGREEQALDVGVALEMVHAASLVHDDIMDRADIRRGRPAVHIRHGVPTAILVGDTLMALAFQLVSRHAQARPEALMEMLSTGFLHLCEGQSMDISSRASGGVDTTRHRRTVEKKTARLIELAAGMGALVAGGEEPSVRCLRRFGLNIGMAFQAVDDLLDVSGDPVALGKTPGADGRNSRQTFLTLAGASSSGEELVAAMIEEYTLVACSALQALPDTPARRCLLKMADDLTRRRR